MRLILHTFYQPFATAVFFLWFILSLQPVQADVNTIPVTTVSAASYENAAVTAGSVASAFGTKLATTTTHATDIDPSTPAIDLPTNLSGTTVQVNGQFAGLLFVSSQQVNFLIPAGTVQGTATIKITSGDNTESNGTVEIAQVRPSIFTFNSNGQGVLTAEVVRVKANGAQLRESLVQRDEATNQFVTKPIDLGPEGERVFLEIYLTGVRGANDGNGDGNLNENVWVLVGGQSLTPTFAGRQPFFAGLDQVNVELPRSLLGSGKINLAIHARVGGTPGARSIPGFTSAPVQLEIAVPAVSGIAPAITNFRVATATAGQLIVLDGSGFAPNAADNLVTIGGIKASVEAASNTHLSLRVPFGAITGKVKVRTLQGEGSSANNLAIRTSISGFVETSISTLTLPAPLRNFTVRVVGTNISATTNQEGVFSLLDVPAGAATIEVDSVTSGAAWAFPKKYTRQVIVTAARDNLLTESFWFPDSGISETVSRQGFAVTGIVLDADRKLPFPDLNIRAIHNSFTSYGTKTDAAGGFVIRNMPTSPFANVRLIASYLAPNGIVARGLFGAGAMVAGGVVTIPIVADTFSFNNAPTNRAPLLLAPKSLTMNVNEVSDVVIYVDDPDEGENLQIGASGPQGIAIIPGTDGAYAIRLAPKSGGTFTVKVTITDSQGAQAIQEIPLTVLAQNSAPTVMVPTARTVSVGQTLSFNVSATDPDAGQTITLAAMNMPQGASFTPASPVGVLTGTFSWTPAANQVGTYTVNFTATDNANPPLSESKSVIITVTSSLTAVQNQ